MRRAAPDGGRLAALGPAALGLAALGLAALGLAALGPAALGLAALGLAAPPGETWPARANFPGRCVVQ